MAKKSTRYRGSTIPMVWEPSNDDREYGRALGLTMAKIDEIAEDMRLWAGANEHRAVARKAGSKGWSLAFKGWMRREAKKTGLLNEKTFHAGNGTTGGFDFGTGVAGGSENARGAARRTTHDIIAAGMGGLAREMVRRNDRDEERRQSAGSEPSVRTTDAGRALLGRK